MSARARAFTASVALVAADESVEIVGLSYKGFTSVNVYDGTDNTGALVLAAGAAPQTVSLNTPVICEKGVYVEIAGTGKGSIYI